MRADELLTIIEQIDKFTAQLRIDKMDVIAERVAKTQEDLYWVYHELTQYE